MVELTRLARMVDIVLIEETHATEADAVCECAALTTGFWWSASACEPTRAGGLLTIVRRGVLGVAEEFATSEAVPGRVAQICIATGQAQVEVTNLHNFGMAILEVNRACSEARRKHALAPSAPTERLHVLDGDFNIEMGCGDSEGAAHSGLHRPREFSRAPASLRAACEATIGFSQPSPTRISHSDTTMSRIDALFSSAPGWLLMQFDATAPRSSPRRGGCCKRASQTTERC